MFSTFLYELNGINNINLFAINIHDVTYYTSSSANPSIFLDSKPL